MLVSSSIFKSGDDEVNEETLVWIDFPGLAQQSEDVIAQLHLMDGILSEIFPCENTFTLVTNVISRLEGKQT